MALIPGPTAMKAAGAQRLWNGIRTGDQRALLFGAGLYAVAWLRANRGPKKELLYRKTIPEGSSFVIRTGKAGELPEIDVVKL
ncbi:MAG: hypothetical protein OEQ47_08770 [Acidimicrobiia bacterium]|nr:hypothetical protein [Acidimicrobiia bacterium]